MDDEKNEEIEAVQTAKSENEEIAIEKMTYTAESEIDETQLTDDEQGTEENSINDAQQFAEKQTKQQNAEYAKRRREKEQKATLDSYNRGVIEALGGVNPFTGDPLNSESDIEEYKLMREILASGGDPILDYHKYAKKNSTERMERESKQARQQKDLEDFENKYPSKLQDLTQDANFAKFAKGKVGSVPLTQVYEEYESLKSFFMDEARKKYEQISANANASPNSLTENESLKPKSISDMSDEEFEIFKQNALDGKYKKS